MEEFTTKNGTVLYYRVTYNLGGFNYFTEQTEPRCYELQIQRQERGFAALTDLSNESGAVRVVLKEVGRKSKKTMESLEKQAPGLAKKYVTNNYSNL